MSGFPVYALMRAVAIVAFMLCASCHVATPTTTYYVAPGKGDDSADGLSPDSGRALASIQEAAKRARPGDVISLADGVYYGPIDLKIAGTAGAPITIRATRRKQGGVILTNAARKIREGKLEWKLVDESLGLYAVPHDRATSRVLYSGVDLQPFQSLEALKTFTSADGNPGARHGYYFDGQGRQLYVRLHASGKYGSTNPADHLMCVSPRTGSGHAGNQFDSPTYFNLGLRGGGDLHVVVEGITFETPGFAGVLVEGNDVLVRDCWFVGCRSGVSGARESRDPAETSNRVTVEHCDFHQFPTFDDAIEVMELRKAGKVEVAPAKFPAFWWSRKSDGVGAAQTYETGICHAIGSNWVVRNNLIHDAFEALSTWCLRWSRGLKVHDNRMERLVDNAVEAEDHASDMQVYGNLIVNAVEPFSWQPLGGEPWPGPVYIYDNVVINEAWLNQLILQVIDWTPGWFKAGAPAQNWDAPWNSHMRGVARDAVRAPGDGVVVFNNTVYFPHGEFFSRVQPNDRKFENFLFVNNVSIAAGFSGQKESRAKNMEFADNVWFYVPEGSEGGEVFAGNGGQVFQGFPGDLSEAKLLAEIMEILFERKTWEKFAGIPVPRAEAAFTDAGGIKSVGAGLAGGSWRRPEAGPRP